MDKKNNIELEIVSPNSAALWASEYLNKKVTSSNIIYLVNYGKIANYSNNSQKLISLKELKNYYDEVFISNSSLDSPLSFSKYKESETTKHIHRLHPYKGKFIPQLVEYFLDDHTDEMKTDSWFSPGDIILDPFCGSGTTLCVANELHMNSIGVDISVFNTILSNVKIKNYNLKLLSDQMRRITEVLENFIIKSKIIDFDLELSEKLSKFNKLNFPTGEFKRKIILKEINEKEYARIKEDEFIIIYQDLVKKYNIDLSININGNFLEKWYLKCIKNEILFLKNIISEAPKDLYDVLMIVLSRTARSCRATTHSDLATLINPVNQIYYCHKHARICKPIFSILKWWKTYSQDTLKRIRQFEQIKSKTTYQICLNGDSTDIDLIKKLQQINPKFADLLINKKISGIFSSPPYVGLIDYHEQHAYSYDIFNLERKDSDEIGSMREGQGRLAQEKYTYKIAEVLNNMKKFLKQDYNIFLVANDRYNLYSKIANQSGMKIVNHYDRPVINRSEKDKNRYAETIFHFKEK